MNTVDRYPVSELLDRYSIGKSKLYADYLGRCGIKPTKIQGRAYITADDLKLLDEYHAAEGQGEEAIAQFIRQLEPSTDGSGKLAPIDKDAWATINWLSGLVEKLAFARNSSPPLQSWQELEQAAASGWILPTSKVAELIGTKPKGDRFDWGGFVFEKSFKVGRQSGWRVVKRG